MRALLVPAARQRMLRSQHHERRAEDGVDPGGEDLQTFFAVINGERDARPVAAADPIALHRADALRPAIEAIETIQ